MFWASVEQIKLELGVTCVYNADQSGIYFEYLPKRTLNSSGDKTVWVRCSVPAVFRSQNNPIKNSDTTQDNTAACRGFGTRLCKEIKGLSSTTGVQIYRNRSGWWNSELTVEFLDYHFADRSADEPVLLLLDDFSAHWTDVAAAHAQDLNVFLLRVPHGLTSVRQPADVAWFGPMKRRLREERVQFLMR